jgi:mannitol/fructose-specific phosphotransferase system IIA component (Ntr-type)
MNLAQYTETSLLVPRLLSEHRDSAIAELASRLEKTGRIDNAREFTHAVLDHEALVSAVFDEVAFPHARGQAVTELSFALGLSPQGIRWGLGKAPTVHAVVLFAVPLSAGQPYLSLVVTFSKFLQGQPAFSTLRQCAQPEEMFAALKQVRVRRTGPQLAVAQP